MTNPAQNTPNYFELLELDPTAAWDEQRFQTALNAKRAEWTTQARNPKFGPRYSHYLELVPQIMAAMSDPATRNQLAQEAIANLGNRAQQLQIEYNDQLDLLTAKGFVTDDDVDGLIAAYDSILSPADIRDSLKRRGVEVRRSLDLTKTVDDTALKQMQTHLDLLGKRDLYDFLEMNPTASNSELQPRADSIYQDMQRKATKTSEVTAASVLAGYAMQYFRSDDQRRAYDEALNERRYEVVLGTPIARLLSGGEKMIYAGQFQHLLESARANRLDVDKAKAYIINRARQLGAGIELVDAAPIQAKRVCPTCATLNDPTAAICTNCGTALKMMCPGCGREIFTEYNYCANCHFPVGDLFVIKNQLDAAFELLRDRRYDLADTKFNDAWYRWEQLPDRAHNNDLIRKIEWQFEQAQEELDWQYEKLASLNELIDHKQFYAARDLLRELQAGLGEGALTDKETLIEDTIADVEQRLKAARAADPDTALQRYIDILHDCADCQPARDELTRIPPTAPRELTVEVGGNVIRLGWEPSTSQNVRYAVVRKIGSRPISANDGTLLVTVSGTTYDDTTPPNGLLLYYAVFTERGGIYSEQAAIADQAVLLRAPIHDLTANIDNGRVTLSWAAPDNTSAIRIRRDTSTFPPTPSDGDEVSALTLSTTVDGGLDNDTTYYYSVFALYAGPDGDWLPSPPATITAMPQQPPTFITDMQAEVVRTGISHVLRLRFAPPPKGDGAVLLTSAPPDFYAHQIVPQNTVIDAGPIHYSNEGVVQVEVESARIVYLTPVVLFGGMAYVGQMLSYASLEDVQNLQARNVGQAIQLRWEWPRNCDKVIVAYSHTDYPKPGGGDSAIRQEITRATYQRRFFTLENPAQGDYYFTVFAIISQDGQELVASGYSARALIRYSQPLEIRYRVQKRRGLGGTKFFLALDFVGDGRVPAMVLVRQAHVPPHTRAASDPIVQIDPASVAGKSHRVEIDPRYCEPTMHAALFLAHDADYESQGGHARILNPSSNELKLF